MKNIQKDRFGKRFTLKQLSLSLKVLNLSFSLIAMS